ncbi:unnamed protein product [Allacma fusca]|uniref:Uncharacterized protein n=1 Tax=Allacma fusca TaxID=39272 RepID=A0A8J2PBW2_9HEXA|nr:unnamed protein product [Allacma fusca]
MADPTTTKLPASSQTETTNQLPPSPATVLIVVPGSMPSYGYGWATGSFYGQRLEVMSEVDRATVRRMVCGIITLVLCCCLFPIIVFVILIAFTTNSRSYTSNTSG